MQLSDKLITLRKRAGLSQEQLAGRLDVSRQAVSRWELGSALPDAGNLLRLSRLFGVSADVLLDEDAALEETPGAAAAETRSNESRAERQKQTFYYLLTVEIMALGLQGATFFLLRNVFFELLSLLPLAVLVVAFAVAVRKKMKKPDAAVDAFCRRFYRLSAWLGLYFPIRLLCASALRLFARAERGFLFECAVVSLYLLFAALTDRAVSAHFRKREA